MKEQTKKVERPWGYELIWAHTERYAGKILYVRSGNRLSLQYHRLKDEVLFLLRGKLKILIGEKESELKAIFLSPGESIRIKARIRHRIMAIEESEIIEASTPELDDVVRLADDYGRVSPTDS